jgi:hypothetical protein
MAENEAGQDEKERSNSERAGAVIHRRLREKNLRLPRRR